MSEGNVDAFESEVVRLIRLGTFNLDDVVHSAKADEASEINHSGLVDQICYLLECTQDIVQIIAEKHHLELVENEH